MFRRPCMHLRRVILLAVLLIVGQTPLPWRHHHAELSNAELAQHLKLFHLPGDQSAPPDDWHWHISLPEQIALESSAQEILAALERDCSPPLALPPSGTPAVISDSADNGPGSRFLSDRGIAGQQTYLRLKILLI